MENAGNDSFIPKKTSEEEGQLKIVVSEKIGDVFCSTASFLLAPCNIIPEGCNHACFVKQKNGYHLYINQTLSRDNYFCLKCNSFIHSTDSFEEHLKKLHSIKPATKKKKKSAKSLKSASSVKPLFKIKQPTEFNDYLLGSELGKGAYGCVYKGFSTRSGNYVAIKTIELQNKDSLEGVQQEIDIMKHLDHVNIIRYIESHKTDDYLYIVMEYAEQGSLQSIQKEYGNFSERLAAKYTQEILKGLQYLHSQYIIHHDIKQGNILMINNMPKLSDFGISIKLDSNLAAAFDSQCSPYWAAPEIINGEAVTEKSDIWALGITVIEMIDGQPPYFDLDPIPAMYKIAQGLDTPLPDKISPELKDFLQICLKRDQVFRASVEDLLSHPWIKMKTSEDDFSYDDYGAMEYMSPNKFSVQRSNSSSNELHLVRSDSSSKPGLNTSDLSRFKDDSSDSDDLFTSQTLNQSNKPLLTVKPNELRPLDEDLLDSTLTNFNSIDNDEKQISLNDFADDDDSDMDCFATTGQLKLQSVPSTPHATSSNRSSHAGLDAFCEDDDNDNDIFGDSKGPGLLTLNNNTPLLQLNSNTNKKTTLNDMKDSDDDLFEDTPSNNKPLIQLNPATQNKPLLTLPTTNNTLTLNDMKESDDDDLFEDTPSNNKPLIQLNPATQNKPLLTLPTTNNKSRLNDMKESDDDDLFEDTPSNNKPLIQLNPTTQNQPLLRLNTTDSKPESNESDDDDLTKGTPSNNKPLLQFTPHKQNKPPLPFKPDSDNKPPLIPNQPLKNRTISAPIQKLAPLNTEAILFTDASSDDQSDDTPAFLSKPPLLSLTPEINNKPSIDLTIKPNPPASNSIDFLKNIDDLFEDDDAEQQEKEKMNELMKATINEIDLLISLCQDPLKNSDMIHICTKLYTKFSTEPFLKENLAGFHGVLPIVSLIQTHNQVLLENAFPFILVATTDQIETQNLLCLLGILPYLFEYVIDRKYSEEIQQYSLDMLHSFCISMGKPLQFFVTTGGLPKIAKVFELYSHQERPELTKPVIEIIDAVFNFHSSTPKSCFARIAAQSNLISLLGQRFANLSYDDPLLEILCKIFEVFSTGSTQVKIKMADSEYIDNIFTKARSNPNGTEHNIEQSKTNSSDLNDWNLYTIIKAMNNLAMDKNVIPTLWKTNFVTRLIEHIQAVGQHTMDLMQSTCFTAIFHLTRILVPENLPKIKSLIPLLPWIIMNDTSVKEIATTIFLDIINEHIDVDDTRIELQNNQGIDTLLYLLETSNHKENIIASLVTWAASDSALIGSELIKHIETVVEIVKTVFEEDLQIHQAPFANNFLEICDRCCDFTQKLEEVGFVNFIVNKLISDDYKDNAELRKAFLLFILSILQSSQNPEMIREKYNLEYVGNKFLNDSSMPVKNLAAELLQSIRT